MDWDSTIPPYYTDQIDWTAGKTKAGGLVFFHPNDPAKASWYSVSIIFCNFILFIYSCRMWAHWQSL